MNSRVTAFLSILPLAFAVLPACSSDDTNTSSSPQDVAGDPTTVLTTYADNLHAAYDDSANDEQGLIDAVDAFTAAPSEAGLAAAKTAWLASRAHYMLTEGARFYDGPIDVGDPNIEALINSWPLDEAYIDYTTGNATAGFVNNPASMPNITAEAIDTANAQGGDDNISDGWHAAEFLLWGQATDPVGPGKRPYTDYVAGSATAANVDRRTAYLKTTVATIKTHLTAVRDQWAAGASYRTTFVANKYASVALALDGLGRFSKGELASQRINAGYVSKERRDQHDCFSSETLTDYVRDATGVQNMYLGNYGTNDGPGLDTLVARVNPTLDTQIKTALQASIDAIKAVQTSTASGTFEEAIAGADDSAGRKAVLNAVNALRTQGDLFASAAKALGLTITVPESND